LVLPVNFGRNGFIKSTPERDPEARALRGRHSPPLSSKVPGNFQSPGANPIKKAQENANTNSFILKGEPLWLSGKVVKMRK
jgi:hypothetical protein